MRLFQSGTAAFKARDRDQRGKCLLPLRFEKNEGPAWVVMLANTMAATEWRLHFDCEVLLIAIALSGRGQR